MIGSLGVPEPCTSIYMTSVPGKAWLLLGDSSPPKEHLRGGGAGLLKIKGLALCPALSVGRGT